MYDSIRAVARVLKLDPEVVLARVKGGDLIIIRSNAGSPEIELLARIYSTTALERPSTESDRFRELDYAAKRLAMSVSWLYKHHTELPFVTRIGGRLKVSEKRLEEWLGEHGGLQCVETAGSSGGGRSGG